MDSRFTGRVTRNNPDAKLIRVFVDFDNLKYLNKNNIVTLWKQGAPNSNCKGLVVGKSSKYILIRIPKFGLCSNKVPLGRGFHLTFDSQDLNENIQTGKELIKILVKKRLGIKGQLEKSQKEIKSYTEKIERVNERYELLRRKLLLEWNNQLTYLEEDNSNTLNRFKSLEVRLDEVDHKLERYRVSDSNLKLDRWSLDPKYYYKK